LGFKFIICWSASSLTAVNTRQSRLVRKLDKATLTVVPAWTVESFLRKEGVILRHFKTGKCRNCGRIGKAEPFAKKGGEDRGAFGEIVLISNP